MAGTGRTANGWSVGLLEAVTENETARFVDGDGQRREAVVEPLIGREVEVPPELARLLERSGEARRVRGLAASFGGLSGKSRSAPLAAVFARTKRLWPATLSTARRL